VPQSGRVLDVGCAYGFLLKYLRDEGYETFGVEVSRDAAQQAISRFGLQVSVKPLAETHFPDDHFDAITVWDVIEHFPDPVSEIVELRRILRPNGVLSIITPDSGSFQARLWGRRWVEYLRPEEHIYFFSRPVLTALLKRNQFEVLESLTAGKFVPVSFVMDRLKAYSRPLFSALHGVFRWLKLDGRILYVDPRDKMFVNFKKRN
jgi:SAM-dependent methyltransferase